VLGVPLYGRGEHLHEALESLLAQTHPAMAVVLCDDGPGDEARGIVDRVVGDDPRFAYRRNERRAGLVENWCRTFELAGELHPDAAYFGWASDHDTCHPRWLERLVDALERTPAAVVAYGQTYQFDAGRHVVRAVDPFETAGLTDPRDRLARTLRGVRAGDMVYGIYRREPLARAGVLRRLLLPDRLLLAELSVQGESLYVPRALRYRRVTGRATLARQRASLFQEGESAPAYTRLPWWAVHTASFAWAVTRGDTAPEAGTSERLGLIATHARHNFAFAMHSRLGRMIDWLSLRVRGGLVRAADVLRRR
jgi:glycosyltransferase involved in cell wall biosynthesis